MPQVFSSLADRIAQLRDDRGIDHFKAINDRYGIGDHVLLRMVMSCLTRDCAGTDALTGRLGGEEFAIVVSAGLFEAHALAQRLSRGMTEMPPEAEGARADRSRRSAM